MKNGLIGKKAPQALGLLRRYCDNVPSLAVSAGILADKKEGFTHLENGELAEGPDGRAFEICSITKTVTGSLLCRLLSNGELNLSDKVSRFFGVLPQDGADPTVEQLATHTAGYGETLPGPDGVPYSPLEIPDIASKNPYEGFTKDDVARFVRRAKKEYAVKGPVYSNLGIAVLTCIMAKVKDKGAAELLKEFIESDMELSGFSVGRPKSGFVTGADENGRDCGNWLWGQSPFVCVGGLYADTPALLRYAAKQLKNEPSYLSLGHVPRAPHFETGNRTGICWFITDDGIVWHNGGTGCFKTFFGFDVSCGTAAAVLSNQKARNGVTPEQIGFSMLRESRK